MTEKDIHGIASILFMQLLYTSFETTVSHNYPLSLVALEINEHKMIVDKIYHSGIKGLFEEISTMANFGAKVKGYKIMKSLDGELNHLTGGGGFNRINEKLASLMNHYKNKQIEEAFEIALGIRRRERTLEKMFVRMQVTHKFLENKKVIILGYGSQGKAHAKNLRIRGYSPIIGLRKNGQSWHWAKADGFNVCTIEEAIREADCISMLLPDDIQTSIYNKIKYASLREENPKDVVLIFAHGFNVHHGLVRETKNIHFSLVAPKGTGEEVGAILTEGRTVPAVFCTDSADHYARELTYAYADGVGFTNTGLIEGSFREETNIDNFMESALCGGTVYLLVILSSYFSRILQADIKRVYGTILACLRDSMDMLFEKGWITFRDNIFLQNEARMLLELEPIQMTFERKFNALMNEVDTGLHAEQWLNRKRYYQYLMRKYEKEVLTPVVSELGS